ncbi:unnamed protein product [Symbiodinium pilosum]|uniref:C3H1-type domain-containing protein n=1 Tax=Symbiodinium pilosum TaxID=2952 RepID=A0A812R236_SYMPI|nr:unnamed protein product [Symbiodinium pilosum]
MDDPPAMEIGNNVMGIPTIQRIMSVHDTALAMAGTAHLARLKHYTTKFLGFLQTRLEPDCGLRVPTVLEAQQADRILWGNIFGLVLEKDWSVDDSIFEYSEIRAKMATLLQPRRGKGGKPNAKGKGQGPQWIKNVTVNGSPKQLCMRWQSGRCLAGTSCPFIHACAYPKSDGSACVSKDHNALGHQATPH